MNKNTLNKPPSTEEKIYFKIMTQASKLFNNEINQSAIAPEKKQIAIVKSAIFTAATLIFQQSKAEKMDAAQLDELTNNYCNLLYQAVKGICKGAQSVQKNQEQH